MTRTRRWLVGMLVVTLLVGAAAVALRLSRWKLPPQWDPTAPLTVDQPINLVTRWKLEGLEGDDDQCLQVLAQVPAGEVEYLALEDYTPVPGCPLSNVVRLEHTGLDFGDPFTMSCPFTVAWLMFERQRLQPLAREVLGSAVTRVDHYGGFACRNVYNRSQGRRSAHATASALDVAGFGLADGRSVRVLQDWDDPSAPTEGEFLRRVHGAACEVFGTVLGPEYNDSHANHFHFDTQSFGLCR